MCADQRQISLDGLRYMWLLGSLPEFMCSDYRVVQFLSQVGPPIQLLV